VLRVLGALVHLSDDELTLMRRMGAYGEVIPAGAALGAGERRAAPRLILRGWACRQRVLPDGRRQIFGFLLPGDSTGLGPDRRALDEQATVALTRVECIDATILSEILALNDHRHDGLRTALSLQRHHEDGWLLDHVVRLGRLSAVERTAHLILELRERLVRAGLSSGAGLPFPLTQEVLADSLGLSLVHTSRILGQMKHDGVIALNGGWLTLLDEPRLCAAAGFSPSAAPIRQLRTGNAP
jgi:CRP-like cAMP-binding protein